MLVEGFGRGILGIDHDGQRGNLVGGVKTVVQRIHQQEFAEASCALATTNSLKVRPERAAACCSSVF